MPLFQKDPDAVLDFKQDWSEWLAATGDTIVTSTWIVPTGITKANESATATAATVWLSGGTAGQSYAVVNRIVTAQSRTDDRTLQIFVLNR